MTSSKSKVVHIQTSQQNSLTSAQKKFNSLIQKIDAQKKVLVQWQEVIPRYQQEVAGKLMPLRAAFADCRVQMVTLLDSMFLNQKFTKLQQEKIAHLIVEMCGDLIRGESTAQHHLETLKVIYARYSGLHYDDVIEDEREMANDFMRSMFEESFGVDLGDEEFDFNDLEETTRRLQQKMLEQQPVEDGTRRERKKTVKQLAKEKREREEAANVSKSIQAVYRQLVAALHPDRESDLVERERKTELMKKVTVAYGKQDLLQLLELQLSVEQIDQMQINNIAEDRLKYYNKVLQNQLVELQEEVMLTELKMKATAGYGQFEYLSPTKLMVVLNQDIRMLENGISHIQEDMQSFTDIKYFKSWLKTY